VRIKKGKAQRKGERRGDGGRAREQNKSNQPSWGLGGTEKKKGPKSSSQKKHQALAATKKKAVGGGTTRREQNGREKT